MSAPSMEMVLALLLDRLLGEPPNRWHPVAWLGHWIAWLHVRLSPGGAPAASTLTPARALLAGAGVTAGTLALTGGAAWLARRALGVLPAPLRWLCAALLLKPALSWRLLDRSALVVARDLETDDLPRARNDLCALVSRPASELSAALVAAAAIESVAENASDSVIAPLFWYALLGLPGAWLYRAINTLDAMLGYRGAYEYVGKVPARLDDLANLVPARLTALAITLASPLAGTAGCRRLAWKTAERDHALTASPNAGWPMAAMAGALAVVLEKPDHYQLGSGGAAPEAADIQRAVRIARGAVALGLLALLIARTGATLAKSKVAR